MPTRAQSVRTAQEARLFMAELLTLRCPNASCAHAVHMDESFDECFALQCASCPSHFCAWCLHICDNSTELHSHVLDCRCAPEDMHGSALYLHDHNGGPHLPPNPQRKFRGHWTARLADRAAAFLDAVAAEGNLPAEEMQALRDELRAWMNEPRNEFPATEPQPVE